MKKRLLSLVLCLVMVFSLFPFAASAESETQADGSVITNPVAAQDESGALNLTKTLTPGENGTYDITMESYATAEVSHQDYAEKVPTDFVIIVDQSGSMATTDMPVSNDSYTQASNVTLKQAAEGMYYVKDGDQYYRVYGQRGYLYAKYNANTYYTYPTFAGDELFSIFSENDSTEKIAESRDWFYYRDDTTGQYYKARIRVRGVFMNYECYFSSLNEDGTERQTYGNRHGVLSPSYYYDLRKVGSNVVGAFSEKVQEVMYLRKMSYNALYYRDVNGQIHYLNSAQGVQTAEFCNQNGDATANNVDTNSNHGGGNKLTYSGLYQLTGAKETRLSSLETALNAFVGAVANEKDDNGSVDNRIAIVGFSSASGYDNTELLTGVDIDSSNYTSTYFREGYTSFPYYGANYDSASANGRGTNYNGAQYGTADITAGYPNALLSATDGDTVGAVNPALTQAIKSVTANGGTQPEYGFEMAEQIFKARTDTTYVLKYGDNAGDEVQRNKVVIFFTDGEPGDNEKANRYEEANQVVGQALDLKHYVDPKTNTVIPATVFTIGIFSNSDSAPLTYVAGTSEGVTEPDTQYTNHWSYVDKIQDRTYTSWGTRYYDYTYLFRQWVANQPTGYGTVANDTIFDYMSVVSSNYPDAEGFITQAWLDGNHEGTYLHATNDYRHIETHVKDEDNQNTNKYYRMASNQDTLVKAFLEAVTLAGTASIESQAVEVDETAHLIDTVNTSDFSVEGATYSVYKYPIKYDNGSVVPDANREIVEVEGKQNLSVPTNGTVDVTGFDYSGDRVSELKPEGWKLVVKITGIVPTFSTGAQPSNDGKAAIMADGAEKPVVDIDSPTLDLSNVAAKTYVIDFNAKMKVATNTTKLVGATNDTVTGTNGNFVKSGTDVTYQLNSANQAAKTAVINEAYTGVDTATVYGKLVNVENAKLGWSQITTVPASSVYYSDKLDTAVAVGDGSGYNAGLANQIGTAASQSAQNAEGPFYFTFYGTGIDVYCTTHDNGGYVSATLFTGSGVSACVKANRVGSAKTIRNYSACDYYNTPSVSFTGLTAGTYTLKIQANEAAQYKLDGVRVYNPVQAGSAAETELNKTDEAYATYLNLRSVLLNDNDGKDVFTVTNAIPENGEIDPEAVSGVLFLDDVDSIVTESNIDADGNISETPVKLYRTQFEVYKANGPKNEIYLDGPRAAVEADPENGIEAQAAKSGQALTFQLNTAKFDKNTKVYIGLSAPNNTQPVVKINGVAVDPSVTTVMDMYYPVNFNLANAQNNSLSITITNDGPGVVSVTNLKITGVADLIPAKTAANSEEVEQATRALFAPVTMKTVRMAANNGVDPDAVAPEDPGTEPEVTPDPTPDPIQTLITQLISSFVNSLFNSIARLFGH